MNADGSRQTRLATNAVFPPAWSPDGQRIAFTAKDGIYVMNADGSGLTRLSDKGGTELDTGAAWSPDASHIAFLSERTLYAVNADGSGQARLAEDAFYPSWSPDGRWIVFWSRKEVFVVNPDGSGKVRLAKDAFQPSWSPDGDHVLFTRISDPPFAMSYGGPIPSEVWVMDSGGCGQTRIAESPAFDPVWSPET
mgnify:CR=1 FL=1